MFTMKTKTKRLRALTKNVRGSNKKKKHLPFLNFNILIKSADTMECILIIELRITHNSLH